MIDSTLSLSAVVDERSTGAPELVVQRDGSGERQQPLQDPLPESSEGASAVALQGERSLAAPEDRLDALADRRQVGPVPGLVLAPWSEDPRVQLAERLGERPAGVALVADQGDCSLAPGPRQELQGHLALISFRRGHRDRSGCAVGCEDRVQAKAPEEPGVALAVAVVGGICER